jgi:hypothetical protein
MTGYRQTAFSSSRVNSGITGHEDTKTRRRNGPGLVIACSGSRVNRGIKGHENTKEEILW